jgi:outer membrane immunogenic protein
MATLKRWKCVIGALPLGASLASAADLPSLTPPTAAVAPPPAFTWTGGYAGSNIGVGFLDSRADPACINPAGVSLGNGCAIAPRFNLHSAGFIGGMQSGYNLQFNSIVVGVESDIQGAGIDKSTSSTGTFPQTGGTFTAPGTITAKERLDYFGTVRGRVGYAYDRLLIYATGGLIYADTNLSYSRLFPAVSFVGSNDSLRFGGVIGGGLEYAFTDRWSAKIEGLYYNLGDKTLLTSALPAPNGFQTGYKFRDEGEIIRIGLNYRFGSLW